MHHIFIMSDGTGNTAQRILNAALTQFEPIETDIHTRGSIREEHQVEEVIREAQEVNGLVIHTIVSENLRNKILDYGRIHSVETLDLMGPLLANLSQLFEHSPLEQPGLFHQLNRSYFQRIEAMEFALRHDDGQRHHELTKAELVILGVSRTFKTPVSIYLAFKGWMVGNVPIVLDISPPAILDEIPPERVVCFTTRPKRLALLRRVREQHLGGAGGRYADREYVREELIYANRYFNDHPDWPVIDVTNKPIEEIGSEIVKTVQLNNNDQ